MVACGEGGPVVDSRTELSADSENASETGGSVQPAPAEISPDVGDPPEPSVTRTLETCPHAFQPSLVPIPPPAINRKNSARRVRSMRQRIERIEVIEVSTYRVLFTIDDPVTETVRSSLAEPLLRWTRNTRTASLPAWPIALLFHVRGEPQPFLGWFFDDGDVYFVEESDPWNASVFEEDGETFRDVFSIPTSAELSWLLSKRFGEYDPLDQLRWSAQRREDARCGRVSQPRGETFPQLPKAIIEPAD
jgi:hypothetical protein